jgi:hypothetical protein
MTLVRAASSIAKINAKKTALPTATPQPTTAAAVGGSARGDDFSGAFGGADVSTPVQTTKVSSTPRTKSQLQNAKFGLGGGDSVTTVDAVKQKSILAAQAKKNKDRQTKMTKDGKLASDNMRASNLNTTSEQAPSMSGTQSSDQASSPQIGDVVGKNARGGLDKLSAKEKVILDAQNAAKAKATQLTNNEATAADNITSSDTPVVQQEKSAATSIASAAVNNPMAQTLALLDQQIGGMRTQLNSDVKNINDSYAQSQKSLEGQQSQETGQQSVQLANAGGYLGYTGSGQGVMLKLAESHRAEISALDAKRQQAIAEAQTASRNRQWDVVKEKAAIVADTEKAAYDAQIKYNDQVKSEADKSAQKAQDLQTESNIFDAIQGGAKTPKDIFNKLGGSVDAKTITDFLTNITKDIGGTGAFKFSAANNASLIGAGMSSDDIKALNEYVNENGYTDKVRGLLTPSQRAAADKVFKTGGVGSGNPSGFTAQEKRKLEQAGLLEGNRQDQLDFLYGDNKSTDKTKYESTYTPQILDEQMTVDGLPVELQDKAKQDLYNLGFGSDVVPKWYQDYANGKENMTINADKLKSSWSDYRKKALGEQDTTDNQDGGLVSWVSKYF